MNILEAKPMSFITTGLGHYQGMDDNDGNTNSGGGSSHKIVGGVTEHVLWVVLTILYSLLCLLVVVQLLRIIVYRHNVVSFQGGFLSLSLIWSALRLLFWFSNTLDWPEWVQLLCYWLPDLLQFATFADLVVYYLKIVYIRQWDRIQCKVWTIYITANLTVSVALSVWLYLFQIVYKGQRERENDVAFYYSIFSGITFGVLMVFISYYGYRVFKIRLTRRMRLHHPFASTTVMVGLTFLVFIVFLTRCIYGFLQACGGHAMSDPVGSRREQWKTLPQAVDVATFVLLILWELLPTFALVMLFRRIPKTSNNLCTIWCDKISGRNKSLNNSFDETFNNARTGLLENGNNGNSKNNSYGANGSHSHSGDDKTHLRNMSTIPSSGNSNGFTYNGGESPRNKKSNASSLLGSGNDIFDNENRYDSDGESSPYSLNTYSLTPGTPLFLNNTLGAMGGQSFNDNDKQNETMQQNLQSHTSPYDLLHGNSSLS